MTLRPTVELPGDDLMSAALTAVDFARGSIRVADRMVETVTEEGGSLRRSVSLTLSSKLLATRDPGQPFVFPLLVLPRRQHLLDGFDAETSTGEPLFVLPRSSGRALSRHTIATAWELTVDVKAYSPLDPIALIKIRTQLLRHVPGEDVSAALRRKRHALDQLSSICGDALSKDAFNALSSVARFFTANYVLWGRLPAGAIPLVKYAYLETLDQRASLRSFNGLRVLLGLSPYRLELTVRRPSRPESYHMRVDVPEGHYVYLSGFADAAGQEPREQFAGRGTVEEQQRMRRFSTLAAKANVHYEGSANNSHKTYSHLYLHGVDSLPPRFRALVVFREIPPGSLGPVSWLLTLQSLLVACILLGHAGLSTSGSGVSLAAVVLTLPAIAAGLIGQGLSRNELLRAPLLTRFGLWLSALTSVWAVAHLLSLRTAIPERDCRIGTLVTLPNWICSPERDSSGTSGIADALASRNTLLVVWVFVTSGTLIVWWRRFLGHEAYHHPPLGRGLARSWVVALRRLRNLLQALRRRTRL